MGLDAVEIVLQVEEAFSISITDAEASQVRTVGDMHDLVMKKIPQVDREQCLTAKAFYCLRRGLMQMTGRMRGDVRPDTSVDDILPPGRRRRSWPRLAEMTGLKMPALHRPPWIVAAVAVAVTATFGAVCFARAPWAMVPGLPLLVLAAVVVTRPFATVAPGCATVGDLARAFLARNFRAFSESGGASANEIWDSLQRIIAEELGVRQSDVTRQARFREDLNVG